MPIGKHLTDQTAFGPAAIEAMSKAFEEACNANTVDAACHCDRAKLVNSATEYMGKALVTEGMDR
jgi:hypothetical protein